MKMKRDEESGQKKRRNVERRAERMMCDRVMEALIDRWMNGSGDQWMKEHARRQKDGWMKRR